MVDAGPLPTVRRHPLVGLFGGLLLGLGVALLGALYSLIALGTLPPIAIVVGGTLLGGMWGRWGPVRTVGTAPKSGRPQADQRVLEAMDENVAAIDRAERELLETGTAPPSEGEDEPVGPLPDIGPPGDGVWSGDSDISKDPPGP